MSLGLKNILGYEKSTEMGEMSLGLKNVSSFEKSP